MNFSWQSIIKSGVNEDASLDENRRTVLSNKFMIYTILSVWMFSFLVLTGGNFYFGLGLLCFGFICLLTIIIQKLLPSLVVRTIMVLLSNSIIFILSISFGLDSGVHYLFFALVCMPFALFRLKDQWNLTVSISTSLLFWILISFGDYDWSVGIKVHQVTIGLIHFTSIALTFLLLITFIYSFLESNEKTEIKLRHSLKQLQEKEQSLLQQNEKYSEMLEKLQLSKKKFLKNEKELVRKENQLSRAQEIARIGHFEIDFEKNEFEWSEVAASVHNLPSDTKMQNTNWEDIVYKGDINKIKKAFGPYFDGNKSNEIEYRVGRNNNYTYILCTFKTIFNSEGKVIHKAGTVQDITKLKTAEEKLSRSERRFRDIASASGEFIWEIDEHENFVYLSRNVEEMIGLDKQQIFSYKISKILKILRAEFLNENMGNYIKENRKFRNIELKITNPKNKRTVWLNINGLPVSSYEMSGYRGAARDITKRKLDELELKKAKEKAELAARAKSAFLSNMSHEIRTPMNAVIGLTDLLLQKDFEGQNLENLKSIKFAADNLLVIINDILDFSKIESGKFTFHSDTFSLKKLIAELKNTLSFKANEKGLDMNFSIDEKIPEWLYGDQVRVNQILLNLGSNAVKFTNEGSVNIFAEFVEDYGDEIDIRFKVKDTGIGIGKNEINEIFESFTQVYTNNDRKYGGTGLGLAITKSLVEKMNGTIQVDSEPGLGSEFIVTIRLKKGKAQKIITEESEEFKTKDLHEAKILLAEDNKINQFVAKQILDQWNVNLKIADNGQEAIDASFNENFDLILMDLQMPLKNGYEATDEIQNSELSLNKSTPIIALTADAFEETRKKALKLGMRDLVSKPFDADNLFIKVANLLKEAV